MDEELHQLCKEVYKRFPEWVGTVQFICNNEIFSEGEYEDYGMSFNFDPDKGHTPLYTSDYLLEKLPPVVQDSYDKKFRHIQMWINGDGEAIACYVEPYDKEFRGAYTAESDSMLKALLKLTVALSEAGELDNE